MTTLAEASVQVVADNDGFDRRLVQQIEDAGGAADRASRTLGRRLGATLGEQMGQSLARSTRNLQAPLSRLRGSFDQLTRSLSRTLDPASRSTLTLARNLGRVQGAAQAAGRTVQTLGDAVTTTVEVGRDGMRLLAAGINQVGVSASEANTRAFRLGQTLNQVGTRVRGVFEGLPSTLSDIGSGLSRAHTSLTRMSQTLARVGAVGVASLGAVGAALLALPAVASLAATTAAGAFGTGIAAIGIIAAAQSEEVQEEFTTLGERIVEIFTGISGPIERALSSLASDLTGLFDDLAPNFERSFATLGPALEGFFSDITGSLRSLGPLSETASDAFAELLEVLGPALAGSVERLATSLDALFRASDPDFFADTVVFIVDFTAALIDLITWLSQARAGLADDLAPAARALEPLVSGLAEGLRIAGEAALEFGGAFLDAAVPAVAELEPLMADLGTAFEVAGGLIAGVLDDLTPVLDALQPFVEGFVEGFQQARDVIIGFFSELLGELGPVEGALESFAEWLGENEELVRLLGVAVGSVVGVLVTYRAAALAASIASGLFSTAVRGVGVAIRSIPVIGWIITAIGLLIVVVQQLWERSETFRDVVTGAWEQVSSVLERVWEDIQEIFEAFGEAWDRLVEASQADTGIGRVWEGIQDAVTTAWEVIQPIFDQIGETWDFLVGLLTGDRSLADAGELIGSYFENLGTIGENIAGFLIRQLERVPGLVLDALGFLGDTVAPWLIEQLAELPGLAAEGLGELAEFIGGWFSDLPDRIAELVGATDGWLPWLSDLAGEATERLQGLGESIAEYIQTIPDIIAENVDPEAVLEWLREAPGRIVEFMSEYGPQILRGLAIALGIVVAGIPALFAGLLASILFVLGVIAYELLQWAASAFTAMMERAGQAVGEGISSLVEWFQGLPDRLLGAVAGLTGRLVAWGAGAVTSLRTALTTRINALQTWWRTTWEGIFGGVRTLWNNFITWAGGAAGRLRDAIMGPISTLSRRMVSAFNSARQGIQRAWAAVRSAVATPIEWVVNTVYNQWIRGVWGRVVDKFGGSRLPEYTVKFAKGGVFPGYTPGRDVHAVPMAAFSGGESVLRPEVTRAWGARTTHWLNKLARSGGVGAVRRALAMLFGGYNPFTGSQVPRMSGGGRGGGGFAQRFASGGIVNSIGGAGADAWKWLTARTDDFADGMLDFLLDPKGTLQAIFNQIVNLGKMPGGGTAWGELIKRLPRKIIDMIVERAKELFAFDGDWTGVGGSVGGRLGAALAFAKAQAGKPYVWGGVGPRGYDCSGFISAIHNVIVGKRPYSRRYTTHPFTGSSFGGFRRGVPSPFMIGVTHANVGHMAGTLLRTNVESRGSAGVVVGPRARGWNNSLFTHRYGLSGAANPRSTRMDGEGILYDTGGWLQPGISLLGNFTRKPESIRTWAQEKNVSRMVKLLQDRVPLRGEPLVPESRRNEFARMLSREGLAVGAGTIVNAPITLNAPFADPELVAARVVDRLVQKAGV